MKKKLLVALTMTLVLTLVSFSTAYASIKWYETAEWEPNNAMRRADGFIFPIDVGYEIYGVVSSADEVDWYELEPDTDVSGILDITLDGLKK